MYALTYIFILTAGVLVSVRRGMRASVWWVAFYSTAIYSLPIGFGYDAFGQGLAWEAQAMMLCVLAACLACASLASQEPLGDAMPSFSRKGLYAPALICVAVSLVSLGSLVLIYGTQVFFVHKTESGVGGQFTILWRLSASLAVLSCLISRSRILLLVALIPLIATLFAGDRTAVGLTAIAALWWYLRNRKVGLTTIAVVALPAFAVAIFLFFGKTFQAQWVTGTYSSLSDLSATVLDEGASAIVRTEPFATIGVMNALTGFGQSPPDPLILEVAAQLLIFPSFFGFQSSSFNDFYQPLLFPGARDRSLAYSFWGEGYLRGGWFGFFSFLAVYLVVLNWFHRLVRSKGFFLSLFALAGGAYWAFYIHRNSLVSIIAYERQIVLFCVVLYVSTRVLRMLNDRVRN